MRDEPLSHTPAPLICPERIVLLGSDDDHTLQRTQPGQTRRDRVAWIPQPSGRSGAYDASMDAANKRMTLIPPPKEKTVAVCMILASIAMIGMMACSALINNDPSALSPIMLPGVLAALGIYICANNADTVVIDAEAQTMWSGKKNRLMSVKDGKWVFIYDVWAIQCLHKKMHLARRDNPRMEARIIRRVEINLVREDGSRLHVVDMDDPCAAQVAAKELADLLNLEILTHP